VAEATEAALQIWNREPLFHLSSPREGWQWKNPCFHHDFIDPGDFPAVWMSLEQDFTVEVEAKAKELAVNKLRRDLSDRGLPFQP
jgi:UV DNA damage endonuclease